MSFLLHILGKTRWIYACTHSFGLLCALLGCVQVDLKEGFLGRVELINLFRLLLSLLLGNLSLTFRTGAETLARGIHLRKTK